MLGSRLRSPDGTQSCGCIKSKGELKIIEILTKNNIPFKTQIKFDDCKDKDYLRFDFGIYNNQNKLLYLIEYDGIQHFDSRYIWKDIQEFYNTKRRDNIKNEWCKKHNIPLIRIPYTKYETLNLSDLTLENNNRKGADK